MNREELQFYNYIYVDPRKPGKYEYKGLDFCLLFEPFYVGKGKNNRYLEHIQVAKRNNHSSQKENKIRKLLHQNYNLKEYIIILNHTNDEFIALDNETKLIKSIGLLLANNGPLTNHSYGGIGGISRIISEEEKISRSENHWMKDRNYNDIYGKEKATDIKNRKSKSLKGHECYKSKTRSKKISDANKNKISAMNIKTNIIERISSEKFYNNPELYKHANKNRIKCIYKNNYAKIKNILINDIILNPKDYKIIKDVYNIYDNNDNIIKKIYSIEDLKSYSLELGLNKSTLSASLYNNKKIIHNSAYGWYVIKGEVEYLEIDDNQVEELLLT